MSHIHVAQQAQQKKADGLPDPNKREGPVKTAQDIYEENGLGVISASYSIAMSLYWHEPWHTWKVLLWTTMFASALCGVVSNGSVICFHLLQPIIARKQVSSDAVWQP